MTAMLRRSVITRSQSSHAKSRRLISAHTTGISTEDIRWLLIYLGRVTDEELRAGLRASGAAESIIEIYTRSIRDRII